MLVKLESLQQKSEIFKEDIAFLEQRFVVLYRAIYYTTDVSTCRWILFANGSSIENILLISAAIRQHILRAMLQAAKWYRYFQKQKKWIDPSEWGREIVDNKYLPFWSEVIEVSSACRKLIKCSFKKTCRGRCKCF